VISGRSARLLAGGEFAVPTTVGIGGAAGTTTSFRGYGTSLQVTPTVEDRDMIRISTLAEYSDLDTANAVGGIPGTQSRRIETVVEMREGQTLALAGLLSHKTLTVQTRIPYLGDIPKIGPLFFSSKRSSQEENELLILITPEIVRPMDAHEVPPMPGFEVTHPMDHEFYKYNMTEGMPDPNYSQLPPYGSGSKGTNVGYQHFNPGPANSMYSPSPTNPNGTGFSSPTPIPGGMPSGPATAVPMGPTPPPTRRGPVNSHSMNDGVMLPNAGPNAATQAGYMAPTRPSQAIMPTNSVSTQPSMSGNAARAYRDQAASNRY
jgi:pilus assembly protein CpaC